MSNPVSWAAIYDALDPINKLFVLVNEVTPLTDNSGLSMSIDFSSLNSLHSK